MATYVWRNGELVDRRVVDMLDAEERDRRASGLPSPRVSRMDSFESPVTGKTVSSWRERDRDMSAAGAVDPRDLPRKPFEERAAKNARRSEPHSTSFEWRDPD